MFHTFASSPSPPREPPPLGLVGALMLASAWCSVASSPALALPFPAPPPATVVLVAPVSTPGGPEATAEHPVQPTYRDLHPVRHPFMAHWHQATTTEMSGPGASPWYRDTATHLDVRWRLAEMAPEVEWIEDGVRNKAIDMALTGVVTGWNQTVSRTLRRTPELVPVQTAIQSALTPGLHFQKSDAGRTRVSADSPDARNQKAAVASINQGPSTPASGRPARARPTVRTGSAVSLVRIPDSGDLEAGANAESPLSPGISSWIDVREVLVDAARVQARFDQNPERNRFRPTVRWMAVARQGLMPNWAMVADVQGTPERPRPTRNGVAIEHNLTPWGLPAWAVRLSAGQELRTDLEEEVYEERVMVLVRANLGWYLPQDPQRWPLGHRPGAPGPYLPALPPGGPGTPQPLAQSPAERSGAGPLVQDALADDGSAVVAPR